MALLLCQNIDAQEVSFHGSLLGLCHVVCDLVAALSGSFTSTLKKASSYLAKAPLPEFTAVYQYIFYRALEKEPLYGIDAVMTYARQSTDFIFMETAVFGDLPENIRRWSEQIEYDTDNPDILLSLITK